MKDATDVAPELVTFVERLHAVASELADATAKTHAGRIRCAPGCAGCCADGLSVFEVEAAVIARRHAELLAGGAANVDGGCAFLDAERRCRIYDARPYVCRTQGLPLRWLERDEDGQPAEARDICPLNVDGGPPLEELAADDCWTIGPFEQRLADAQRKHDGGEGRRVALRSLFASEGDKRRLPVMKPER